MEAMAQTGSKKLPKRMVQEIASSFSEELSPGFSKEVLEEISNEAHVATCALNTSLEQVSKVTSVP